MNDQCCNHFLTIESLSNNEKFSYSLIVIKGSVETLKKRSGCNDKWVSITLNKSLYKSKTQHNQFKTLLPLNRGDNLIVITYCDTRKEFNVIFEPRTTLYRVVPMYILVKGHEGNFQSFNNENTPEIACEKIYTVTRIIQSFYAEKMNERHLGRKTFQLESDLNVDFPKCSIFHSRLQVDDIKKMSQEEIWTEIAREIMNSSIGSCRRKYLGFFSSTCYNGEKFKLIKGRKTHEKLVEITDGYVALGGGGLALFGSASLYCWPRNPSEIIKCFLDSKKIDPVKLMDDSCYRGTFGACFATTLGSVCHELGHTFDLGHSDHGLMGRGFDNIHRVFVLVPSKLQENRPQVDLVVSNRNSVEHQVLRNDLTVISPNCATILNYHKWFGNEEEKPGDIRFDGTEISSAYGIQIVEIRTSDNELVIDWWKFSAKSLIKNFKIPTKFDSRNHVIFAEDFYGNIFKTTIIKKNIL